uniref:ShKT domain-containing protein n=1 Tax=Meloidogyne javanica TaxID=6303 RepID=A0A915MBH1_MELJA
MQGINFKILFLLNALLLFSVISHVFGQGEDEGDGDNPEGEGDGKDDKGEDDKEDKGEDEGKTDDADGEDDEKKKPKKGGKKAGKKESKKKKGRDDDEDEDEEGKNKKKQKKLTSAEIRDLVPIFDKFCININPVQCLAFQALCAISANKRILFKEYYPLMSLSCNESCGYCTKSPDCVDARPNE